jgi:hypothetical protein
MKERLVNLDVVFSHAATAAELVLSLAPAMKSSVITTSQARLGCLSALKLGGEDAGSATKVFAK